MLKKLLKTGVMQGNKEEIASSAIRSVGNASSASSCRSAGQLSSKMQTSVKHFVRKAEPDPTELSTETYTAIRRGGSDEVDPAARGFQRFLYERIMQYAFHILSRKRYTVKEMREKLANYVRKRKGDFLPSEDLSQDGLQEGAKLVDEGVLRLLALGYLNDKAYARDYIAQRLRVRPRGKALIGRELMMKGIAKVIVKRQLDGCEIDEAEVAKGMILKKAKRWAKYNQRQQKTKAYAYLASKGFERDTIYRVIESCYYNNVSWD